MLGIRTVFHKFVQDNTWFKQYEMPIQGHESANKEEQKAYPLSAATAA